jgi:hypothetical protein
MVTPSLIAAAIAHVEGFYSTKSLAYRHNNPGNLRHHPPEYDTYTTIDAGWHALLVDIMENHNMAFGAFLAKYAPNTENDTAAYITEVCRLTGYSPSTKMEFR